MTSPVDIERCLRADLHTDVASSPQPHSCSVNRHAGLHNDNHDHFATTDRTTTGVDANGNETMKKDSYRKGARAAARRTRRP
jgi:hypothetical protein